MQAISKYFPNKLIILVAILALGLTTLNAVEKSKTCAYRTFNIKTNNKATANELLSELADMCDFSIVVKDNEAAKILEKNLSGINIKNLSLVEIFQIVLSDNDLFFSYDQNFLKISALSTRTFKVDYITSIREGKAILNASVDASPTEEGGKRDVTAQAQNMITSNDTFDFWKTIATELTAILNTGAEGYKTQAPIINPNAGIITVTATKKQLSRVEDYLNLMEERLHKQVLIDVSIISVDLTASNNTGVDWSKFSLSFNSDSTFSNNLDYANANHSIFSQNRGTTSGSNSLTILNGAAFSIAGLIDFLGTNGETKVVSSPKVLTLNNQQALITIGDNINYRVPKETANTAASSNTLLTTTYSNYSIFIGVLLNITPEISENNEIILRINPSVSNFKYAADDARTATDTARVIAPDTKEKKLSTVVKVKDGSTIILGGLITDSKGKDDNSVPLLSSIPLLGEAFKHSADTLKKSELIFVITPKIIGAKGTDKASLKDLGFSQKVYE
ncbi:MAG: pilus (MSHA type) biogenesis protein MshL [Sulfurospirillaceae bacterium]|nr:pilus (MSHA type) biogenesis protein MshL [Sulfurospirillaceae bacterium]